MVAKKSGPSAPDGGYLSLSDENETDFDFDQDVPTGGRSPASPAARRPPPAQVSPDVSYISLSDDASDYKPDFEPSDIIRKTNVHDDTFVDRYDWSEDVFNADNPNTTNVFDETTKQEVPLAQLNEMVRNHHIIKWDEEGEDMDAELNVLMDNLEEMSINNDMAGVEQLLTSYSDASKGGHAVETKSSEQHFTRKTGDTVVDVSRKIVIETDYTAGTLDEAAINISSSVHAASMDVGDSVEFIADLGKVKDIQSPRPKSRAVSTPVGKVEAKVEPKKQSPKQATPTTRAAPTPTSKAPTPAKPKSSSSVVFIKSSDVVIDLITPETSQIIETLNAPKETKKLSPVKSLLANVQLTDAPPAPAAPKKEPPKAASPKKPTPQAIGGVFEEVPFTADETQRLADLTKREPPGEEFITKFGIRMTRQEIQTLVGTNWLNDNILNFYVFLLVERSEANPSLPKVYAFPTAFYVKLKSGAPGILKWTRKTDIFSNDFILIPLHLNNNHWALAVINMPNKTIRMFDSMNTPGNEQILEDLMTYLFNEHFDKKKAHLDKNAWTRELVTNCPQQSNQSDCGVFCCSFAEAITRNSPISCTQKNMPYLRKKIILEICSGKVS